MIYTPDYHLKKHQINEFVPITQLKQNIVIFLPYNQLVTIKNKDNLVFLEIFYLINLILGVS